MGNKAYIKRNSREYYCVAAFTILNIENLKIDRLRTTI